MGVKQYAWSTSPLRRYIDLVNQWQIIACARHGRTAALAAPFKPKDAELFSDHLGLRRRLQQLQRLSRAAWSASGRCATCSKMISAILTAAVFRENLARADDLPLVLPVLGAQGLPRNARVRVRLGEIDLIMLDVQGTVVEHLDAPTDGKLTPSAGQKMPKTTKKSRVRWR